MLMLWRLFCCWRGCAALRSRRVAIVGLDLLAMLCACFAVVSLVNFLACAKRSVEKCLGLSLFKTIDDIENIRDFSLFSIPWV